ncbi:MAG: glycerol-3-phosphate 1-O-acyltransferase PlsY [Bacteroidia bacterium]|nr:glycerol-3-phosphate 1-O-acyltransferase PlsY [Bacteroidia bacterium]
MIPLELAVAAISAYLLGSIPSAVLVGKSFYGLDVREHGSLNAGATNTFRVLGKQAGTGVLLLDIIKGLTAANLVYFLPNLMVESWIPYKILLGILAVLGHIYPVFAGFKGGKGIATLLGLVVAIDPFLALGCVVIFLLILTTTNMVSAGSILTTLSFGILSYLRYGMSEPVLQIFGIFAVILVLYTHRANIKRIWKGEEKKIYLFKKKG